MLNLFLGNVITTISTILITGVLIFIVLTIHRRREISHWGRKVALLSVWGLLVCIFVAARDSYHLSVMSMSDPNIAAGVFSVKSIQSNICCLCGAVIAFCALSSIFIRRQGYLKIMFFILSATIILKMLLIEISRIILM